MPWRQGRLQPSSRKGAERERHSPISRSGKRVAALCRVVIGKYIGTRGAAREDGKVRAARTQKTHAVRSGISGRARSRFHRSTMTWADGTNPAAAPLDHRTPRETAKLFGELGA